MKRIVIDARVVLENLGHGISRHTNELILNLLTLESRFEYVLLVNAQSPYWKMTLPPHFSLCCMRTGWISLLGQIELLWVLHKLKPHLFHSPSFIVPLLSRVPLVTTIHDLNHVVLSENYSIGHRVYYRWFLPAQLKRALKIITVSKFSQNEIYTHFNIPLEKICVIHNGIGSKFSQPVVNTPGFFEKYDLPQEYILTVGNRKPHKNVLRLVRAFCELESTENLVLLSDFDEKILNIAMEYNKKHQIFFCRYVAEDDFPEFYSRARIFVYPSLYEGFGLPPLEAAACGVPVVVSNRSSLPEVMQDGALFVDPESIESLILGMQKALKGGPEIEELLIKGKAVASKYSWNKMAKMTLKIYEELLTL